MCNIQAATDQHARWDRSGFKPRILLNLKSIARGEILVTRFTPTYLHSLVTGDFEIKEHIRIKDLLSLERGGVGGRFGKGRGGRTGGIRRGIGSRRAVGGDEG